ncbi:pyrimidine 5'-nucleotidase [Nitratireductor sp. XY-223]|uniref:pyrimidine 5'-nucleotidase n=1 Tax=Nitratireductor sp. XY-223 TaxID=2561926 RepID=UPI0010A9BA8A|nr:pyrimidine 5'-nucleotidase [Nitratireductor sp. XY-223]
MRNNLPIAEEFESVREWVFDLDNTLYPRHTDLFSQIDKNMTSYVAKLLSLPRDEARKVQKEYYRDYGTTLNGLMNRHGIDANDFLEKVHDIDYSWVEPHPELGEAIRALPGRKYIFTNGDVGHAERTATALGILDHFDEIFDILAADLTPKPAAETYDRFLSRHKIDSSHAVMFEDLPRNLTVPKTLGMRTVLIVPHNFDEAMGETWEHDGHDGAHIDYVTDDLAAFLKHYLDTR